MKAFRLIIVDRPDSGVKVLKLIALSDGIIIIGRWGFYGPMLSKYESDFGKRVPVVGAGEVDVNGNVVSADAWSIDARMPEELQEGIQSFLQEDEQLTVIKGLYEQILEST